MMGDVFELKESSGPFGNSEGSREDFAGFLNIQLPNSSSGLCLNPHDLTTRVIIGRKGSGKTFYLRRLEAASRDNKGYYVFAQNNQLPASENVVHFTSLFTDEQRTDMWTVFWRRMIFRTLACIFFAEYQRPQELTPAFPGSITPETFRDAFRRQIPDYMTPKSIFSHVDDAINHHAKSRAQMLHYIHDDKWDSIERFVMELIRRSPPLCMYIDALDNKCRYAPAAWLDCQKGLFYQVMELLNDRDLANRLHIIISLRDSVRASVLDTEHASKFFSESHIKVLDWNMASAREFLRMKVEGLRKAEFVLAISRRTRRTCHAWLGVESIDNPRRGPKPSASLVGGGIASAAML